MCSISVHCSVVAALWHITFQKDARRALYKQCVYTYISDVRWIGYMGTCKWLLNASYAVAPIPLRSTSLAFSDKGRDGKEDSGSSLSTMGALCYRRIMYNAREISRYAAQSTCTKYGGSAFVARAVKMSDRRIWMRRKRKLQGRREWQCKGEKDEPRNAAAMYHSETYTSLQRFKYTFPEQSSSSSPFTIYTRTVKNIAGILWEYFDLIEYYKYCRNIAAISP